uniref:Uncharacterized protein n=1 Tax=Romanomermis culicivorax TaxID=13658 RepID=A0A915KE05_ROMCU
MDDMGAYCGGCCCDFCKRSISSINDLAAAAFKFAVAAALGTTAPLRPPTFNKFRTLGASGGGWPKKSNSINLLKFGCRNELNNCACCKAAAFGKAAAANNALWRKISTADAFPAAAAAAARCTAACCCCWKSVKANIC